MSKDRDTAPAVLAILHQQLAEMDRKAAQLQNRLSDLVVWARQLPPRTTSRAVCAGKVAYDQVRDARAAINHRRRQGLHQAYRWRHYRCNVCGKHHLTTDPE